MSSHFLYTISYHLSKFSVGIFLQDMLCFVILYFLIYVNGILLYMACASEIARSISLPLGSKTVPYIVFQKCYSFTIHIEVFNSLRRHVCMGYQGNIWFYFSLYIEPDLLTLWLFTIDLWCQFYGVLTSCAHRALSLSSLFCSFCLCVLVVIL